MTPNDARRAARNAGALAAASIITKGMLFAWQVVLARWLGDSNYGIYGTVGALAVIVQVIGNFGMGLIVIRDVSQQPSRANAYLTATVFTQTILGGIAFLILNAAAWIIGYDLTLRALVALTGVGLLLDMVGNLCSDQLLAQERMVTTSVIEGVHVALRIALVAWALASGYGLIGLYVVGWVASGARSVMMGAALYARGVRLSFPVDRSVAWLLLANSSPLALSGVLALAYQQADKLMSTRFLDAASTGYLTAALVIVQGVIEVLNSTILIATYPMMSRYYAERGEMFGFIVEKLALFTAIVTFPAALVLLLFAPDLTIPLFGQDFAPAADVLRLLMVYGVAAMLVNVFAQGMMVQNRQRRLLVYRVGGLVINLTVNGVLLALGYGIIGLVIGSAIAESVVLALLLWTFRENGLLMPRLLAGITRLLAVSAVTLAIMAFVGQWGAWAGIIGGAVIYLGGVLRGGILRADDWDLLYRLVSAMPGGAWFGRFLPKPA